MLLAVVDSKEDIDVEEADPLRGDIVGDPPAEFVAEEVPDSAMTLVVGTFCWIARRTDMLVDETMARREYKKGVLTTCNMLATVCESTVEFLLSNECFEEDNGKRMVYQKE